MINQRDYRKISHKRNKKKKNRQKQYIRYAIVAAAGVAIITLAVFGIRGILTGAGYSREVNLEQNEPSVDASIVFEGLEITGMTAEEATAAVLEKYPWSMTISYQDEVYEVPNLLREQLAAFLPAAILRGEAEYSFADLEWSGGIAAAAASAADLWDIPSANAALTEIDENGEMVFSDEKSGFTIDRESLTADLAKAVGAREFGQVIQASGEVTEPEINVAEAKARYKTIATFSTTATANENRNENLRLSTAAINNRLLYPDEEFSFNVATGNRTTEKGYKEAVAYLNGLAVQEPGGGVCQVSSTLYNAVVAAGLKTTERHYHSYIPSYVNPGEDAMVSYDGYGGPDLRFINNSEDSILIRASFSDRRITVSIIGIPVLEEGVKVSMKSEKVSDVAPPEPVYTEDPTLLPGQEVIVKQAANGTRWSTNLVITRDGEVISDEYLHSSVYKGSAAKINRNTTGVMPLPGDGSVITDPSLTDPSLPNPSLPDPLMPNPSLPDSSVPNPSLPDPSVPNPSLTDPSEPNSSTPDPSVTDPPVTPSASDPVVTPPPAADAPVTGQ